MKSSRTSVAGLAVALALLAGAIPAAADGPPGAPYYARPSIWQGVYGGFHLGWGEADPADGFVGGVQAGYNWQAGQIVYGLEADVSYADISFKDNFFGVEASVDWLATVRGRAGFLLTPRVLAYGTAGFGIASASARIPGLVKVDDTETDFVYGLGIEGKLSDTMSLRAEYLAFGDLDINVVRAGLNFKLGN
jgi:outer membrane immunogenic protein